MAKAELKTRPTDVSAEEFLNGVTDEQQRADSFRLLATFARVTGEEARMWGPAIIGFGTQTLKYPTGRELEWMEIGFSPRKGNLTLYIMDGLKRHDDLMAKLGKHKIKGSCLHIKKMSDVDEDVLEQLVRDSIEQIRKEH